MAAGVRRIEAVAGRAAEEYMNQELALLSSIREQFKNPKDLLKILQDAQTETSGMRKKIESMEMKQAGHLKTELLKELIQFGEYVFIGKLCEDIGPDALRKLAGDLRQELPNLLIVLAVVTDGKPFVVIGLGLLGGQEKDLDASKIVREMVAGRIKGGGGGQKTLASAGGQDAGALAAVLSDIKSLI